MPRPREPEPAELPVLRVIFGALTIEVAVQPGEEPFEVLRREVERLHRMLQEA